jgi:recombination protein RecA
MTSSNAHNLHKVQSCQGITSARLLLDASPLHCGWSLDALQGRFIELVGGPESAALTTAVSLVLEAQRRSEFAAWVSCPGSIFYPPDAAAAGVDLNALPVIRTNTPREAARAADVLLRSKSFALIIVDAGHLQQFSLSMQTRLTGLAAKANTILLCITEQPNERGSLVSFRGKTRKEKTGHDCFKCEITALKDKRSHPGWVHEELHRGADGLC